MIDQPEGPVQSDKEDESPALNKELDASPSRLRFIVAGAIVVIALALGLLFWPRGRVSGPDLDAGGEERQDLDQGEMAGGTGTGVPGSGSENQISQSVSINIPGIRLSPAAKIQAEKFKCVCGCNLILASCTCEQTPGSVDMKEYLQSLVDEGRSPDGIREGMVGKYGPEVLP